MADNKTPEDRSKNMAAIRSVSQLESIFTKQLWKSGVRFRRNTKTLYGKPDISIQKYKVVIFIDSCFWHCCPLHFKRPKTNQEYWDKKISRNIERDKEVTNYYLENNWYIKRIWEHDIRYNLDQSIKSTINFINYAKSRY